MSLETTQKIANLLLTTVAGSLLAAAGFYVTYHSSLINGGSTCSAMGTKLFDVSSEKGTGDSVQVKLKYLIDIYDNSDCQKLTQQQKDFLLGNVKIDDHRQGDSQPGLAYLDINGWVAIGRKDNIYTHLNFDGADILFSSTLPSTTKLQLKARWEVYLRENHGDTDRIGNKVLGIIGTGECVSTQNALEERGQIWAEVQKVDCTN